MLYSKCGLEACSLKLDNSKLLERVGRKAVSLTSAKSEARLSGSRKLAKMFKFLLLLCLTILICLQTVPAYCESLTFQVSVTIPPHVMLNSNLGINSFSQNPNQLIQNQIVIRNKPCFRTQDESEWKCAHILPVLLRPCLGRRHPTPP